MQKPEPMLLKVRQLQVNYTLVNTADHNLNHKAITIIENSHIPTRLAMERIPPHQELLLAIILRNMVTILVQGQQALLVQPAWFVRELWSLLRHLGYIPHRHCRGRTILSSYFLENVFLIFYILK